MRELTKKEKLAVETATPILKMMSESLQLKLTPTPEGKRKILIFLSEELVLEAKEHNLNLSKITENATQTIINTLHLKEINP